MATYKKKIKKQMKTLLKYKIPSEYDESIDDDTELENKELVSQMFSEEPIKLAYFGRT